MKICFFVFFLNTLNGFWDLCSAVQAHMRLTSRRPQLSVHEKRGRHTPEGRWTYPPTLCPVVTPSPENQITELGTVLYYIGLCGRQRVQPVLHTLHYYRVIWRHVMYSACIRMNIKQVGTLLPAKSLYYACTGGAPYSPCDPNNTDTSSKTNPKNPCNFRSGRKSRSPNNRTNVNANTHAPINKKKTNP